MSYPNFQNPLYSFNGIDPVNAPNTFLNTRAPTQYDTAGYKIGDIWLNTNTGTAYILVSLAGTSTSKGMLATWDSFTNGSFSGGIDQVTTDDSAVVTPDGSSNINIFGYHGINTTGTADPFPHTVTVQVDNTLTLGDLSDVGASASLTLESGVLNIVNGNALVGDTQNNGTASEVIFKKSRSGGAISPGDDLGAIVFQGYDGTQYTTGAQILSETSGTIANHRVAADLEFYTHPDSTGSLTKRMVIAPTGAVTIEAPDSGTALTIVAGGETITAGNLLVSAGNVNITAGNLTLPNTTAAFAEGTIEFGGNPFISNYGTNNTFIGQSSGNATLTTASATSNVALGTSALAELTTGTKNIGIGVGTLGAVTTGDYNTAIGFGAGSAYASSESSNIILGQTTGVTSESNTLRIGGGTGTDAGEQSTAYISGINGNTLGAGFKFVTIDPTTDQLGVSTGSGGGGITALNTLVFTTSGTYTPTAGMEYCIIEVVGGGAGGGGCTASTFGVNACGAGTGGGGGYARGLFTNTDIGVSKTVTIGAGGAGGAAGNNAGTNGGTTSVGALISASGGTAGFGGAAAGVSGHFGGAAGSGIGGDFQTTGGPGGQTITIVMGGVTWGFSNGGGCTFFGGGAPGISAVNGVFTANATSFGGGGAGAITLGGSATAGGNGFPGVVYITEYIA